MQKETYNENHQNEIFKIEDVQNIFFLGPIWVNINFNQFTIVFSSRFVPVLCYSG